MIFLYIMCFTLALCKFFANCFQKIDDRYKVWNKCSELFLENLISDIEIVSQSIPSHKIEKNENY